MSSTARKPGRPKDPDLEARRRTEILNAAALAFADLGFASTDVQVIADRVGVGKGTVYRYFATKEALFLAAVERGLQDLTERVDSAIADPSADPLALVEIAIRTYFRFFHERPEMAELFIQERAAFPHHHRPLYFVDDEACDARHDALFRRLVETGLLRDIPRDRFFSVVGDLLYGTILTNLLTGRPADPDAQTRDVLDVVLFGILSPAGRCRTNGESS